jgi:hypothetical protein
MLVPQHSATTVTDTDYDEKENTLTGTTDSEILLFDLA